MTDETSDLLNLTNPNLDLLPITTQSFSHYNPTFRRKYIRIINPSHHGSMTVKRQLI